MNIMNNYKLAPMSLEQQLVVNSIINNNNVIINCCAGAGKTTTGMHICTIMKHCNVLMLTYNSRLKIESREKVKLLNLQNVEVHSYHAFCVKYYNEKGYRDNGLQDTINLNIPSKKPFAFDIIILDEQQDMTKLFYSFVKKIIKDNIIKDIQLCLFGDVYQNIYSYSGSDERYLLYANKIFDGDTNKKWEMLSMSVSFRITKQIANFINTQMLKTDRLKAIKNGPNVKYIITDTFKTEYVYNEILKYLSIGYTPEDIFILGASLKKGKKMSPICRLENKLVINGIPCHASLSDDQKVDDDIIKGKIAFASFHQVKGMERKICIIYGFDESYFNFYAKNLDRNVCPNVLYVALTRASDRLLLVHDSHSNHLPFLDKHTLNTVCDIIYVNKLTGSTNSQRKPQLTVTVRDLIKSISNDSMNYIFNYIKYSVINPPNKNHIRLQSKIKTKNDLYEDVSDINGLTIPAIYEYSGTYEISMLEQILGHISNKKAIGISCASLPDSHKTKIYNTYKKYLDRQLTTEDILYISTVYNSLLTGFIGKREQIVNYTWFEQEQVDNALAVMKKYVSDKAQYEQQITYPINNKILVGIVDTIDCGNNTLFEYKCTSELSKESILQLVIYAYMYEKTINNVNEANTIKIMSEYSSYVELRKVPELTDLCKKYNIDLYRKVDESLVNSKKIKKGKNELIMSLIDYKRKSMDNNVEGQVKKMSYKLLNILSEEIIEIEYSEDHSIIIDYLMNMDSVTKASDDEFLNNCTNYGKVTIVNKNNDDYNYENGNDDDDDDGDFSEYMFV